MRLKEDSKKSRIARGQKAKEEVAESPDQYFEKFAHKDTKKGKKATPKKNEAKPKGRNKRKIDSDEDFELSKDVDMEAKEIEDCVSDSLDLDGVVSESQATEKVEEVKTRKRKPNQIEEENKQIEKKQNLNFDQKKKANKGKESVQSKTVQPKQVQEVSKSFIFCSQKSQTVMDWMTLL